ncbi:unnamed protein product [Triticum turgidum subsp. durum]|uniref:Uncharacterized protein n=1 Tax=Triticum turgidum subsp. durum TaxID=4567 RepID=A0A9R0XA15_TRITD|nr:unnamed protein product [Triticum turgidum subsp. durum]
MDVVGEGAGAAAAAAGGGGGSGGFIHSVVGLSSASTPLLFWLLTVALVAAIHVASAYMSSSSSSPGGGDKETEKRPRRGGFPGDERDGEPDAHDDRVLQMMRSFSFVHASEEDFVEGMAAYERAFDDAPPEPVAPASPPPAPASPSSLSFSFRNQMPEIPFAPVATQEREHEAEEAEVLVEKEEDDDEQSAEAVHAEPKIVPATHNYRFLTERDFRGFVREPATMTVRVQESFVPPPPLQPPAQPEERRVVDVSSRRGGFVTAKDLRPADKPVAFDRVASPTKRAPSRRKPASSVSKGSAASGRTSFASEFSGFGDSDSDSSTSDDGYSVKELVVDSDSDWFHSEKDFSAGVHDAASLRSYKAKVLKAMESLEEADLLQLSFQDSSATTVSPGSVAQASPDSVKYPEDMWSRTHSPEAEYREDDEAGTPREAQEAEAKIIQGEGSSIDMSDDDERSSSSMKKMIAAPVYDTEFAGEDSVEHSEKEIITINDHSYEAISDAKSSPEVTTDRELVVSSHQAVGDTERSPQPSDRELVGTSGHPPELVSLDRGEAASTNGQADTDDKRSPEHPEQKFVLVEGHSHELISDVWKEIAGTEEEEEGEVAYDFMGSPEPSEKEFVSRNAHSDELSSDDHKAIAQTNDRSYAAVSDDRTTPEHSEQEFSTDDHQYGVIPHTEKSSEPTEDKHASADDHPAKAPRHVHFSVTEKAKSLDEEEDKEGKWKDLTEEEEDELESLWEHQDLIEQLKLELKKVRSAGLPTILEESESPKAPMEDLKPWRIDAKFLREDPMDELNKFFKSYRERMRKFDILCFQKMYAIDFLQLRGPQQSANSLKALSPTALSILSHNFRSARWRSPEDPSDRLLKDLRCDLETVYVGQMCLSWEFLRWQYEQACDLPESDPYHSHHYNQVAGEFQQFQVMVQRFVEDEPFKGPRLPDYVKERCPFRNFLQVPVIREDSLKDRMEDQRKGNYVITSEELEVVMEESMHILWEFIKADKEPQTSVLKGLSTAHVELQDPRDEALVKAIHATLQKKEKRLKDLLRTGNCIVKKFKKPKEDRSDQNLFFSQVDMRLVARVLRMPRITGDQLQWCKAKLDKIMLVDNRRIHREASFLLFPCLEYKT